MLNYLLQAETFSADTLVQKGAQLVETIKTKPASELISGVLPSIVKFGLKVLLALVIYLVGAWLIRKIKKLVARAFEKKGSDSSIASFVQFQ